MPNKVKDILLLSTAYEAWILQEDGRLSEQINNEYRGLNLSHPPRLTWASTMSDVEKKMSGKRFDLFIIISQGSDDLVFRQGDKIKAGQREIPVILLTHRELLPETCTKLLETRSGIDQIFFWSGDAGILLAIIKSVEDRLNIINDTGIAGIRVILFVEDSPFYRSAILSVLYKELVIETQAVIDEGLNEEHRLLSMRARPKVIMANSHEEALSLYEQFKSYVLGVISDVRFPKDGRLDPEAGLKLLRYIKRDRFDIPLLLASSEPHNASPAAGIPAVFINKNSPELQEKIADFLLGYLGFGDFTFKMPDGSVVGIATDLYTLEQQLEIIPAESFTHHCQQNDFSRWLFSFAEVELASKVRSFRETDYPDIETHRRKLIDVIRQQRRARMKGMVVDFDRERFDPETGFLKIGKGSLGGKARGLSFLSSLIHQDQALFAQFKSVDVFVPQTLVITTEGFDQFIQMNHFEDLATSDLPDKTIVRRCKDADFPVALKADLRSFLSHIFYPLSVRSSSLLEDARFKPYAGLYKTFTISNDDADIDCRLEQLISAVKMVYASTYFKAPKAYSKRVGNRIESEKMAVIIQKTVGRPVDGYFYPAVSGVAQSKNYYPFSSMKPEDGVVNIALGMGKAVMEGERDLRFSPKYPNILPQRSSVEDTLKNAQQYFYAVKMKESRVLVDADESITMERREVHNAREEYQVRFASSTYFPSENRIRDTYSQQGFPVVTFSSLLKYKTIPLPDIIMVLLDLGYEKLGCPVELEFALEIIGNSEEKAGFGVVQIRPMSMVEEMLDVSISEEDKKRAFCISHMALGNTVNRDMADVVFVKPDTFNPARTPQIAKQISQINTALVKTGRKYILIGPGRWGSADHWLGIPVSWNDISGVGAIVETFHPLVNAEPSHGSHFFHNIAALGINYLNVNNQSSDRIDYGWLDKNQKLFETEDVIHVKAPTALTLKVNGSKGLGVIY